MPDAAPSASGHAKAATAAKSVDEMASVLRQRGVGWRLVRKIREEYGKRKSKVREGW